uniref:Uncharacterized protein n=1 Tax=Helicotheca tamesis TaxID=374047 RepID=A0A7S2IJ17_9STRA|mmetsp:Transcript_9684/g.13559  ORF Transcript_9684/g.13559 Transcript_9684/m.13559 type:complete len:251 (+) Transcript_9684:56-808(+)
MPATSKMVRAVYVASVVCWLGQNVASGFMSSAPGIEANPNRIRSLNTAAYSSKKNDNFDSNNTEPELVTKEMFQRDMLADPTVHRKKKKGSSQYRTLDNRDALPFLVKVVTPDPYTNREQMKLSARKASDKKIKKSRRNKLVGMDAGDAIAASIYEQKGDGSLHKVLGEFQLDKTTNCGDVVQVGDHHFQVQKARCQYKYAGGNRFVMVRKILEVKEVSRAAVELSLHKQLNKTPSSSSSNNDESTSSFE